MAIKVLQKTVNIELCHDLLRKRLNYDAHQKFRVRLELFGDQPAERNYADIAWVEKGGFWAYLPGPWLMNAFGVAKRAPAAWGDERVLCEFDFHPSRNAAFARDDYGGILLLHNGELAGIAPDRSKPVFWQHYQGLRLEGAEQQDQPYAVVAHLGSIDITRRVAAFLDEIARIGPLLGD